jgi:hypothetical protein
MARPEAEMVRLGLVILGLFDLVNGAVMLAVPATWYALTPGVVMSGPMNPHFIRDIGLAFLASGAGLILGARSGGKSAVLALAGATWPALHALLHIVLWFAHGFPREAPQIATEVAGVVVLSALAAGLAWTHAKEEGAL